jgi:hypothetical protein
MRVQFDSFPALIKKQLGPCQGFTRQSLEAFRPIQIRCLFFTPTDLCYPVTCLGLKSSSGEHVPMTIRVKNLPVIFVFSIALLVLGQNTLFAEKKSAKVPIFEVPTSGKIIDVQYRPEFDEWWVKCREGDDIVIYSYEKLTRKWGKVLFTTKKPDEKGKQTEGMQEPETGSPLGETGVGASREQKRQDTGKIEGPKKQSDADHRKGAQKKWWDPLNIIQGGERLISPAKPAESK